MPRPLPVLERQEDRFAASRWCCWLLWCCGWPVHGELTPPRVPLSARPPSRSDELEKVLAIVLATSQQIPRSDARMRHYMDFIIRWGVRHGLLEWPVGRGAAAAGHPELVCSSIPRAPARSSARLAGWAAPTCVAVHHATFLCCRYTDEYSPVRLDALVRSKVGRQQRSGRLAGWHVLC